jgi:cytochrome c oxidase assembly protein subunit 19
MNDEECRMLSKGYLQCRMDNNLMAVDEMKNLGYDNTGPAAAAQNSTRTTATTTVKRDESKKGTEGSLRR